MPDLRYLSERIRHEDNADEKLHHYEYLAEHHLGLPPESASHDIDWIRTGNDYRRDDASQYSFDQNHGQNEA